MNKFKFFFQNWKEIIEVYVKFRVYTTSGNNILTTEKYAIEIKNPIYYNENDFDYSSYRSVTSYLENKYDKQLKIVTKKLLKEHQKNEITELEIGHMKTGKYIVKCIYDVDFKSKSINYKRYDEITSDLRSERIKLK